MCRQRQGIGHRRTGLTCGQRVHEVLRSLHSHRARCSTFRFLPFHRPVILSHVLPDRLPAVIQALRPHQWVKNLLVFLPAMMAHRFLEGEVLLQAVLAFVAFSLLASGTYVINDLVDREHDRRHPTKRTRPFAAGALSPANGYVLASLLIGIAFLLAGLILPLVFVGVLVLYLACTLLYSFVFKSWVAADVVILGGLYALRVFAGSAATGIPSSQWLLAFSLFFFLSLALLKRYSELRLLEEVPGEMESGRGYTAADGAMLRGLGPASGFMAVLVLALYITSPEVTILYAHSAILWMMTPLLVYWIMHVWLVAHRGGMPEDPIVHTVKDPVSWGVGVLTLVVMMMAAL